MEKKIQRDREMEKGEFDDKEAFVTPAYKKKLQERAEEERKKGCCTGSVFGCNQAERSQWILQTLTKSSSW